MVKLVRCTVGKILDVAVDLRVSSPTFGKWFSIELSSDNQTQLLVPVGFAHGRHLMKGPWLSSVRMMPIRGQFRKADCDACR